MTSIDIVAVPRGVDAVISHLRHPIRLRPGVDLVWTTNGIVPAFWDWRPEPERERIRDVGIFQQRRFAARADRIVVWTEHGADHLVSLGGVDAERIRVVPPIMQLADAVGPPFERTDAVRFAYVGAAAELKGLPEAIRAVTATPGAELVVVGWPPMDSFSVPTTGPIRFLGPLSPERVAQLLDDADCLLVPAHQETFGVTYVEAMKHGLPVISTSLGTTTEIVGNAGVLVPPGDVDALTDAVRAMTADSALRRDTAQRARERFATLWAPDVVAPRWESVLR